MNKNEKDKEREKQIGDFYEEYYKNHDEFSRGMQRDYFEDRFNEKRLGVFGNALISFLVIAGIAGIVALIYFVFK